MNHIVETLPMSPGLSKVKTNLLEKTSRKSHVGFYTSLVRIAFGPKTCNVALKELQIWSPSQDEEIFQDCSPKKSMHGIVLRKLSCN